MKSTECSLTTRSFQLDYYSSEMYTQNSFGKQMVIFKSYFAVNKIIFDYLQVERDVQLDSTVVQALGRLLDVNPEYD